MSSTHTLSSPLPLHAQPCICHTEDTSMSTSVSTSPTVPIYSWVIGVPMAAVVGTSLLLQIAAFALVSPETDNQQNPTWVQDSTSDKDLFKQNAVPIAIAHTIMTAVAALYCFLLTRPGTCLSNRRSFLLSRASARPRVRLSHAWDAVGLVLVLCFIVFAIADSFTITRNSRDIDGGQGAFIVGILLVLDVLLAALVALDLGLRRLHRRVLRDQAHQLQEDAGDGESAGRMSLRTMQRLSEDLPKYERYETTGTLTLAPNRGTEFETQDPRDTRDAPVYSS